ncbi:MAG: hypothetical protein HQ581_24285, partial [Planctomycetes bacterium]|nr:hypothetical protein [Planctomycetota bacterium]
ALVEKMIDQAARTKDDPAGRYVLLHVARDVAISAGDVTGALRAVDLLGAQFEIDAPAMRIATLLGTAGAAKLAAQRKALAEQAPAIIQTAVDRDDYIAARQLVEAAKSAVGAARNGDLVRRLHRIDDDLQRIATAYTAIRSSLAILAEKPADPDANAAVGRFYCLVKCDWERGLPMLALGSDAALQVPARKELEAITTPTEQIALADIWWNLGGQAEGAARQSLLHHAATWYNKALPTLPSGLAKARISKRLTDLTEEATRPTSPEIKPREPRTFTRQGPLSVKSPWPLSFPVRKGQTIRIRASGRWRVLPGGKWHGPADGRFYLRGRLSDGAEFKVGSDYKLVVAENGVLSLGMKEGGKYSNNSGSIGLVIDVTE